MTTQCELIWLSKERNTSTRQLNYKRNKNSIVLLAVYFLSLNLDIYVHSPLMILRKKDFIDPDQLNTASTKYRCPIKCLCLSETSCRVRILQTCLLFQKFTYYYWNFCVIRVTSCERNIINIKWFWNFINQLWYYKWGKICNVVKIPLSIFILFFVSITYNFSPLQKTI